MKKIVLLVILISLFIPSITAKQAIETKECPDGKVIGAKENCYTINSVFKMSTDRISVGPGSGCLIVPAEKNTNKCGLEIFEIVFNFENAQKVIAMQSVSVTRDKYGCISGNYKRKGDETTIWNIKNEVIFITPKKESEPVKNRDYCITEASIGQYTYSFVATPREYLKQ